jgi:AhpD family alkylhydroperoxidase
MKMVKIEVFDPPMCCTSGVCGPEPDSRLSSFAGDLTRLQDAGVEVRRFNLAQEPAAFVANPQVKQIVDTAGADGLPVVLVDGRVVCRGEYPSRQSLLEWARLDGELVDETTAGGTTANQPPIFDERVGELVALGAAIAANCEPCFRFHHRKAVTLGIARDDMIQAVNVALQVKEQPAQIMVRLAQKLLAPDEVRAGDCCGGNGSGCC